MSFRSDPFQTMESFGLIKIDRCNDSNTLVYVQRNVRNFNLGFEGPGGRGRGEVWGGGLWKVR